MTRSVLAMVCSVALTMTASSVGAEEAAEPHNGIGVTGALGTDVSLGLGVGIGVNWLLLKKPGYTVEVGGQLFYSHSTYTDDEGINEYTETTDLYVLAVRANALFGYSPNESATYYTAGGGVAAFSVEWEERSPTDISLGTPLMNGGSKQSVEGGSGGMVLAAGIGRTFGGGFDIRLELPIIFVFSEVGEASTLIPTITVAAGYRF